MEFEKCASALHRTKEFGDFQIHVYRDTKSGAEHIALMKGDPPDKTKILCRVASECVTGMILDASDCDCNMQLRHSFKLINDCGVGLLIFLRQEGRGHGLTIKIKALRNKNHGDDTFTAVERLGLNADCRNYDAANFILTDLQIKSIRLITSNPKKVDLLSKLGIVLAEVIPTPCFTTPQNARHLEAKIRRGHVFS